LSNESLLVKPLRIPIATNQKKLVINLTIDFLITLLLILKERQYNYFKQFDLYNNAIGGVKLNVTEADAQNARQIFSDLKEKPYVDDSNEEVRCPSWNSINLMSDFKIMPGNKGITMAIA
tara:strand:+ start:292 stop:651 length:360 start_codon:yes stop_codon:yes gene_type:complete